MEYTLPCTSPGDEIKVPPPTCQQYGQPGHLSLQCPDNVDQNSKFSEQLIIPAPSCSLCGKSGHLYYQCPDNVDKQDRPKTIKSMDQHWEKVDPKASLLHQARLAMRQDYMDIKVAPVGQKPKLTRRLLYQCQPAVGFGDSPTTDGSRTAVPSTTRSTTGGLQFGQVRT